MIFLARTAESFGGKKLGWSLVMLWQGRSRPAQGGTGLGWPQIWDDVIWDDVILDDGHRITDDRPEIWEQKSEFNLGFKNKINIVKELANLGKK